MATYKNKKTGAVINTESLLRGDNWEVVKEPSSKKSKKVDSND